MIQAVNKQSGIQYTTNRIKMKIPLFLVEKRGSPNRNKKENSALNQGAAAGSKMEDFLCTGVAGIAWHRVLQAAGCSGKFDALRVGKCVLHGINQPGGKTVAAANPVDDVHRITSTEEAFAVGIKHGGKIVVAC